MTDRSKDSAGQPIAVGDTYRFVQVSDTSHGCKHTSLDLITDGDGNGNRIKLVECTLCKKRWQ